MRLELFGGIDVFRPRRCPNSSPASRIVPDKPDFRYWPFALSPAEPRRTAWRQDSPVGLGPLLV